MSTVHWNSDTSEKVYETLIYNTINYVITLGTRYI